MIALVSLKPALPAMRMGQHADKTPDPQPERHKAGATQFPFLPHSLTMWAKPPVSVLGHGHQPPGSPPQNPYDTFGHHGAD
jgi:hypothetical protein